MRQPLSLTLPPPISSVPRNNKVAHLRPLPSVSAPLQFRLLTPLRPSSVPVACLVTQLPLRTRQHAAVTDLRDGSERASVTVVRIIDPEHRCTKLQLAREIALILLPTEQRTLRLTRENILSCRYDAGRGTVALQRATAPSFRFLPSWIGAL